MVKQWTDQEEGVLRRHGATHTAAELTEMLPGRTKVAIQGKRASLGIEHEMTSKIRGRPNDLTDMAFERWTVLGPGAPDDKQSMWRCRCDCGTVRDIRRTELLSGNSKSCGCLSAELASERKRLDLIGQTFGELTVIGSDGQNDQGHTYWICRCSCGNMESIRGSLLTGDRKTTCHDCYVPARFDDKTGKRFGKLTVIESHGHNSSGRNLWRARCDCGREVIRRSHYFLKANPPQCDRCAADQRAEKNKEHRLDDLTGQTFGELTVIELDHVNGEAHWLCECSCGNEATFRGSSIKNFVHDGSCGCLGSVFRWNGLAFRSRWEVYVAMTLDIIDVPFEYEPETFTIDIGGETCEHIPDFHLTTDDRWIEVKGRKFPRGMRKHRAFAADHPAHLFMRNEITILCGEPPHRMRRHFNMSPSDLHDHLSELNVDKGRARERLEALLVA